MRLPLLPIFLTLALGCGGDSGPSDPGDNNPPVENPPEEPETFNDPIPNVTGVWEPLASWSNSRLRLDLVDQNGEVSGTVHLELDFYTTEEPPPEAPPDTTIVADYVVEGGYWPDPTANCEPENPLFVDWPACLVLVGGRDTDTVYIYAIGNQESGTPRDTLNRFQGNWRVWPTPECREADPPDTCPIKEERTASFFSYLPK